MHIGITTCGKHVCNYRNWNNFLTFYNKLYFTYKLNRHIYNVHNLLGSQKWDATNPLVIVSQNLNMLGPEDNLYIISTLDQASSSLQLRIDFPVSAFLLPAFSTTIITKAKTTIPSSLCIGCVRNKRDANRWPYAHLSIKEHLVPP